MSLELVLLHNQKNGTESFQVIGTEKHIRKRIEHVHQFPVTLSPFLSHKYPLSPKRSRKLMTLSCNNASCLLWPTPFPPRGGRGRSSLPAFGARQESRDCRCGALEWKRGKNPAGNAEAGRIGVRVTGVRGRP